MPRCGPAPQALVFTGDLADRAEPDAYATLRSIVEPAAAAMGAIVVWTMGNHDERSPYARGLFDSDDDGFQDRVHEVDGLRIVALDTSVPGYHHGELEPEQLAWLADVLATPAEHGTLLAMHHPPLPLPMLRAAELIELHDQQSLADVIAGTDVRGILAGHLHLSTWSTFAGVPVSVASASCYTSDPAPVDRFVSGVDAGQAFTMVHTYDDRLVHTLVPLERGTEVSHVGSDIAEALETVPPGAGLRAGLVEDLPVQQLAPPTRTHHMRLLLMRHGQTHANVSGELDTAHPGLDLTDLGRAQAAAAARALSRRDDRRVYVSSRVRTHQTAQPTADDRGLDLVQLDGLEEIQAGDFEMRNDHDAVAGYIGSVATWLEGDLAHRMPGGETGEEFLAPLRPTPSARSSRPATTPRWSSATAPRCAPGSPPGWPRTPTPRRPPSRCTTPR